MTTSDDVPSGYKHLVVPGGRYECDGIAYNRKTYATRCSIELRVPKDKGCLYDQKNCYAPPAITTAAEELALQMELSAGGADIRNLPEFVQLFRRNLWQATDTALRVPEGHRPTETKGIDNLTFYPRLIVLGRAANVPFGQEWYFGSPATRFEPYDFAEFLVPESGYVVEWDLTFGLPKATTKSPADADKYLTWWEFRPTAKTPLLEFRHPVFPIRTPVALVHDDIIVQRKAPSAPGSVMEINATVHNAHVLDGMTGYRVFLGSLRPDIELE